MRLLKSILRKKIWNNLSPAGYVVCFLPALTLLTVTEVSEASGAAGSAEQTCRLSDHESRLTSDASKIRSIEKEIADLIDEKNKSQSADKSKLITEDIAFKYRDLEKQIKDYEEERAHVRFQHPEGHVGEAYQFQAARLKSLDEIKDSFGLDARLDRIKKQVQLIYPATNKSTGSTIRLPASVGHDEDLPERIHLVK